MVKSSRFEMIQHKQKKKSSAWENYFIKVCTAWNFYKIIYFGMKFLGWFLNKNCKQNSL